ncbi:MAG TPA: hypothetical protein VFS21_37570 [Roseiflexaceae bacterium]|nr:hypothetical protein [Roseiflexaceae bacterium]
MRTNGTGPLPSAQAIEAQLGAALREAEQTGLLDPALWPALRALLLGSTDPAIVAATAPLRTFVQARQRYEAAYMAFQQEAARLPPVQDVVAVGQASESLQAAIDELVSRAAALQQHQSHRPG